MKHITNAAPQSYKELWQSIFPKHYQDKYIHKGSGLSGGYDPEDGFYTIHLKQSRLLTPEYRFDTGSSIEYFEVPKTHMLRIYNISTSARCALYPFYCKQETKEPRLSPFGKGSKYENFDAAFRTIVKPAFKGWLTIELLNNLNTSIELMAGQPIVQLFAERLEYEVEGHNGRYKNQPNRPVGPR